MAVAREATPVSSAADIKQADLDREDLLQIYRNMLITRGVEERGHILYRQGKIPGSFYTGRGNEGASVGVATAMRADDVGTPIQRDMGVHVTRGTEPWRIFAQYMGRSDGLAAGKDGNVHMADIRLGLIAMVSHLPALMPVAVGCALAFKIRKRAARRGRLERRRRDGPRRRARGDEPGRRAPAARSCSSSTTTSTPTRPRTGSSSASTTSPTAPPPTASRASSSTAPTCSPSTARRTPPSRRRAHGGGPTLLELVTLRMEGHAVHDDAFYVPRELLEAYAKKDPIERYRRWLKEQGVLDEVRDDEIARRGEEAPERGDEAGRGEPPARALRAPGRRLRRARGARHPPPPIAR